MAIVFSDWHLDNRWDFGVPWEDGLSSRTLEQFLVGEQIFNMTKHYNTNVLVFLGDLFDKWNNLPTNLVSKSTRFIYDMMDQFPELEFHILAGNHDMPNKRSTEILTIDLFMGHPRIFVHKESAYAEIEDQKIAFVPYNQDHEFMLAEILQLRDIGAKYLFSHLDLIGAQASIDGYIGTEGINLKSLEGFEGGVFGHYHKNQTFKAKSGPKFNYVGSPLQLHPIDEGQSKGCILFRSGKSEFIPVPSPIFVSVDEQTNIDSLTKTNYHILKCPRKDAKDLEKYYRDQGFLVKFKGPNEETIERIPVRLEENKDPLQEYIRMKNPETDPDELLRIGKSYIE